MVSRSNAAFKGLAVVSLSFLMLTFYLAMKQPSDLPPSLTLVPGTVTGQQGGSSQDTSVAGKRPSSPEEVCLLGRAPPTTQERCRTEPPPRSCLRASFRPWAGVTYRRFQACLKCCLQHWSERLELIPNVAFWYAHVDARVGNKSGIQEPSGVLHTHNDPLKISHAGCSYRQKGFLWSAPPEAFPEGGLFLIQSNAERLRRRFLGQVLPTLPRPVVLGVLDDRNEPYLGGCPGKTHALRPMDMDGDPRTPCPEDDLSGFLDDPKLLAFLSPNPSSLHPKVLGYPRALVYRPERYVSLLHGLEAETHRRSQLLFCTGLNVDRDYFRAVPVKAILANNFNCSREKLPHDKYFEALMTSKFVFAPRGFGRSTHRVWEALLAGAVPVTERDPIFDADIHKGLPMLRISNWSEVTPGFLEQAWVQIQEQASQGEFDATMAKIYWPYWFDRFTQFLKPELQE